MPGARWKHWPREVTPGRKRLLLRPLSGSSFLTFLNDAKWGWCERRAHASLGGTPPPCHDRWQGPLLPFSLGEAAPKLCQALANSQPRPAQPLPKAICKAMPGWKRSSARARPAFLEAGQEQSMAMLLEEARRGLRDFELSVPLDFRGIARGLQQTMTAFIRLLYTVAGVLAGGTQVRSAGPCRVPADGGELTPARPACGVRQDPGRA